MINITKFAHQLIPSVLQGSEILQAYIRVLLFPVSYLLSEFQNLSSTVEYQFSKNAQVCYLESLLNDTFDTSHRRIYISDPPSNNLLVAYRHQDVSKRIIVSSASNFDSYKILLSPLGVDNMSSNSFTVNCPSSLSVEEKRLSVLVSQYKLAGKICKINYF
jgi:hypothetical protein